MSKRSFFKKVIKTFFFILLASFSFLFFLFTYPFNISKKREKLFELSDVDSLPKRGIKKIDFSYLNKGKQFTTRIYLSNINNKINAFSPVCTHLGCLITWNRFKNRFICPCHGGEYDVEGSVISGPPRKPLNRLTLKVEGEKAYIGLKV